jgi:hypothetical protein
MLVLEAKLLRDRTRVAFWIITNLNYDALQETNCAACAACAGINWSHW